MQMFFNWLQSHHIVVLEVFGVILLAFAANFIIQRVLKGLSKQLRKTDNPWDDALTDSASRPIAWCVALYGFSFSIHLIEQGKEFESILTKIDHYRDIAVLALIGWFLVRFIKHIELILTSADKHDKTTVIAITRILRATVIMTFALFLLQALGYSVGGIMAFGGIGGIAIGFAAKDLLANFFGGLMIYLDRPFTVGDWVRSPDKEIEGTVEYIGWRSTRIRTFDKRPLYVPNALFTTIAIENPSRMLNRRIKKVIGVRYDDANKIENISIAIKKMLTSHPDIDQKQVIFVSLIDFAPSSLNILIYAFTKTTEWVPFQEIQENVMLKILEAVESCGGQSAFPTSTIEIPKGLILSKQEELHVRES